MGTSDMRYDEMTQRELEILADAGLKAATTLCHRTSTNAGWHSDRKTGEPLERNFGEMVALMHSELSEALEADRKGLNDDKLTERDGVEVELADCLIRIFDAAGMRGYDLAEALIQKNQYNQDRADHKLENRNKTGGKKY